MKIKNHFFFAKVKNAASIILSHAKKLKLLSIDNDRIRTESLSVLSKKNTMF